eukprot:3161922-Amphidinium_carterae.1
MDAENKLQPRALGAPHVNAFVLLPQELLATLKDSFRNPQGARGVIPTFPVSNVSSFLRGSE